MKYCTIRYSVVQRRALASILMFGFDKHQSRNSKRVVFTTAKKFHSIELVILMDIVRKDYIS